MKKEMNNKGFSLVELIIVIAIMAVLIGLLAPQYLKYLNNSKVSGDISNAQTMATTLNAELANGSTTVVANFNQKTYAGNADVSTANVTGLTTIPQSKLSNSYSWYFEMDNVNGVTLIKLDNKEIYPNPEKSGAYYATYHK